MSMRLFLSSLKQDCNEIIESKSVLKALIIQNLVGRYRNSTLKVMWHFVMPMIVLFVYTFAFASSRNMMDNFWIYLSSAVFPFNFMVSNITVGAACIINNSQMIKKMYFPREIIVISQVLSSFIIMIIGYCVVLFAIVLSGYAIDLPIIATPVIMILMSIFVFGCVLLFSSISVYHRDILHLLSSISIIFFFITPMYFTMDNIPGPSRLITWINPLTYFIDAFHQTVYYGNWPQTYGIIVCTILAIGSLFIGLCVFQKLKNGFAERI